MTEHAGINLPMSEGFDREGFHAALGRMLEGLRGSMTLVVNDGTRPAVAGTLLARVAGLVRVERVLVATGTHADVSPSMKDALLGGLFADVPWTCNSMGGGPRVDLGTTSRGTRILVHPWVAGAGALLVIGSVEPHYFAGFTGGRKAFLPGCTAYSSTEANHWLACSEGSAPAVLEGNPVHEDMVEACALVEDGRVVIHACCVAVGGAIGFACAGSIASAFGECVRHARTSLCRTVDGTPDRLVLRPGGNLEGSLYQAMKAVYNWEPAVARGGVLLLDCPCREGLGAPHMEGVMRASMAPGSATPPAREDYRLGDHSITRLARIRGRARLAIRSWLPPRLVERLGMEPVDDLDAWLESSGGRVLFVEDAGSTVPAPAGAA